MQARVDVSQVFHGRHFHSGLYPIHTRSIPSSQSTLRSALTSPSSLPPIVNSVMTITNASFFTPSQMAKLSYLLFYVPQMCLFPILSFQGPLPLIPTKVPNTGTHMTASPMNCKNDFHSVGTRLSHRIPMRITEWISPLDYTTYHRHLNSLTLLIA